MTLNGDFIQQKPRPIRRVITEVSRATGVSVADILGNRRHPHIVRPHFMAMAICRDYLHLSYPAIGRAFNRDHSTVINAMRRVDALCADADLDDMEAIAKRCGLVEDAYA